jgi:hypothetical protein
LRLLQPGTLWETMGGKASAAVAPALAALRRAQQYVEMNIDRIGFI